MASTGRWASDPHRAWSMGQRPRANGSPGRAGGRFGGPSARPAGWLHSGPSNAAGARRAHGWDPKQAALKDQERPLMAESALSLAVNGREHQLEGKLVLFRPPVTEPPWPSNGHRGL